MLSEGFFDRKEQFRLPLKDEWKNVFKKLKNSYDSEEIPSPIESIRLQIGMSAVYISRRDIVDAERSSYYPILKQVARLRIENESVVGIEVDEPTLVADTFLKLSSDPYFSSVIDFFGVDTHVSEKASREIAEQIKKEAEDAERKMKLKNWFMQRSQEAQERKSLLFSEIEENSINVLMDAVSHIDRASPQRYIVTLGAGPCIVAAGYNAESGTAAITHMDSLTNMREKMGSLSARLKHCPIRIFGGDMSSLHKLQELKDFLDSEGVTVEEWDVLNSIKSIAIDKETGEFFDVIGKRRINRI